MKYANNISADFTIRQICFRLVILLFIVMGLYSCEGDDSKKEQQEEYIYGGTFLESVREGQAKLASVAVDSNGNAVVVWTYDNNNDISNMNSTVWGNRFVVGQGWSQAEIINTGRTQRASDVQVTINGSGNALAMWRQSASGSFNYWVRHYELSTGWGKAEHIVSDTSQVGDFDIAMNDSGDAVVVWHKLYGTNDIWSTYYQVGMDWSSAKIIGTEITRFPKVGIDGSRNAVSVWDSGKVNRVNANSYLAGADWETEEPIDLSDMSGHEVLPQLAMDNSGTAISVWIYAEGEAIELWANRYISSTGWETAERIDSSVSSDFFILGTDILRPQLAMDGNGNALAVWSRHDGTSYSIWSNLYVSDEGWGDAEPVDNGNGLDSSNPRIAMNGHGNAMVIWQQYTEQYGFTIWSNRYTANVGWDQVNLVAGAARNAQLAMDDNNDVVVVWRHYDRSGHRILAKHMLAQ